MMLIMNANQVADWFHDRNAPSTVCYARGAAWSLTNARGDDPEVASACEYIDKLVGWRDRPRKNPKIVTLQRRTNETSEVFEYLIQKVRYPDRSRPWLI